MNQAEVGGICCPEGQVNDLGSCEDTCPPHRPISIKGVCGKCGLGEAAVGGICCPEGNVNDEGACQDSCPPIRPISVAGVCGEYEIQYIATKMELLLKKKEVSLISTFISKEF